MGAIGTRRQTNFTRHINSRGTDTTVNGQTIKGLWQRAGVESAQRFLSEQEYTKPAFELRLPASVLDTPYSLKNGMEVTRQGLGWRGVCRNISVEEQDNVITQVNALIALVPD